MFIPIKNLFYDLYRTDQARIRESNFTWDEEILWRDTNNVSKRKNRGE